MNTRYEICIPITVHRDLNSEHLKNTEQVLNTDHHDVRKKLNDIIEVSLNWEGPPRLEGQNLQNQQFEIGKITIKPLGR
jgi:hypothetical protein